MNGVELILSASWRLVLQTPLCVKSGSRSSFTPTGRGSKTRFVDMGFDWNTPPGQNGQVQVSDLWFAVECVDGVLVPRYLVPAKSVRGALRNWCIVHLVPSGDRRLFMTETDEGVGDEASPPMPPATVHPISSLLLNLFGRASGNDNETAPQPRAGALRIENGPLKPKEGTQPRLQGTGWTARALRPPRCGPDNVCRHVSVRGPVDRITQAAKDGGLHYFLEFSAGQSFEVRLQVANPAPVHLDLINLWAREMDYGLLRLGGLASVGRGRVKVEERKYSLFRKRGIAQEGWKETLADERGQPDPSGLWLKHGLNLGDNRFERLRAMVSPLSRAS